jgi:DNA-binding GntR family transcriptional regulator
MERLTRNADLVETVKSAIFDAILKGKLTPGQKLCQDDLAEKLGVSRQPIGQALRLLSEHGIVSPLDKKSLTVTAISQESLAQILDIRCELDSFAAGLAAERAKSGLFEESDFEILQLLQRLEEKHTGTEPFNSFDESVIDDIEFHRLIRALSGNPHVHPAFPK